MPKTSTGSNVGNRLGSFLDGSCYAKSGTGCNMGNRLAVFAMEAVMPKSDTGCNMGDRLGSCWGGSCESQIGHRG